MNPRVRNCATRHEWLQNIMFAILVLFTFIVSRCHIHQIGKGFVFLQSWFEKYFSCHRWWNQFSNEYSITVANFAPLKGEQNKSLNHNHSCSMFTLPRNMNGSNFGQPQPYLLCYACRLEKQPSHGGYYVRSIFKSQGFASSSLDFTKIQSDH